MSIWVDADACPVSIKDILFRAVHRTKIHMTLVANQYIAIPASPFIRSVQVASGLDIADAYIVEHLQAGDLVITADIPLANQVIDKNASALNPRGKVYSKDNIKQHLAVRNFHQELRESGMISGGPAKLSPREIQAFANALDRFLTHNRV